MGEAYFLSGVAGKYGIQIEDIDKLKEIFYGIYLEKAADPTENIGLPGKDDSYNCLHIELRSSLLGIRNMTDRAIVPAGAIELVKACREAGLKVAVASSADRVKVGSML